MPRAVVVIPTKNEGALIRSVIDEIRAGLKRTHYDDCVILVVDDSNDDTRRIAQEAGAVVLRGGGDGLGSAMYKGLKEALHYAPDIVMAVDGDGQCDAANEIPRFIALIDTNEADLVVGSRFLESGLVRYQYRWINRVGTRILSWILRRQTGLPLTDSHGGLRAMRPDLVENLDMLGSHTYVQETIIDAAEKGYRIKEIPSAWRPRSHGESRVVSSIPKYVFYTLPVLILRSGQHIRWLYSIGIWSIAAGVLYFVMIIAQSGFHLPPPARIPGLILVALLVSLGFQLFFFGFVLQLLKQMKRNLDRVATDFNRHAAKASQRNGNTK